jgi:5'-nucleotidase
MIRTLRSWGVKVNSAFFMGGAEKKEVLKAFRAHIFFDDKHIHLANASGSVPAAHVPYKRIQSGPSYENRTEGPSAQGRE